MNEIIQPIQQKKWNTATPINKKSDVFHTEDIPERSITKEGTPVAGERIIPKSLRQDANSVTTLMIFDKAITYAKIQDVTTQKILGRKTAGSGVVEEITCTTFAFTLLDDVDAATMRSTLGVPAGSGTSTGNNTGDQDLSGLVPKTTKVNGHALSSDVTVTASDLGLGSGLNQTINILDGDGVHTHNFTFTNGVLTAYTLTP